MSTTRVTLGKSNVVTAATVWDMNKQKKRSYNSFLSFIPSLIVQVLWTQTYHSRLKTFGLNHDDDDEVNPTGFSFYRILFLSCLQLRVFLSFTFLMQRQRESKKKEECLWISTSSHMNRTTHYSLTFPQLSHYYLH